jgi:hypothetical protein
MTPLVAMLVVLALGAPQEAPQEKPKVPKDSLELTVIGCLKGRVLKAIDERQVDVESSPYVGGRSFHLASKKKVTDELKRQRVAIGGGSPSAGTRSMPNPADNVIVMDVSAVRMRSSSCTGQ